MAPSKSPEIRSFQAASENDEQSASLYRLPVGGVSSDILEDIDDWFSFPSLGMRSKKVSKLLQFPGVLSHYFYMLRGRKQPRPVP